MTSERIYIRKFAPQNRKLPDNVVVVAAYKQASGIKYITRLNDIGKYIRNTSRRRRRRRCCVVAARPMQMASSKHQVLNTYHKLTTSENYIHKFVRKVISKSRLFMQ